MYTNCEHVSVSRGRAFDVTAVFLTDFCTLQTNKQKKMLGLIYESSDFYHIRIVTVKLFYKVFVEHGACVCNSDLCRGVASKGTKHNCRAKECLYIDYLDFGMN